MVDDQQMLANDQAKPQKVLVRKQHSARNDGRHNLAKQQNGRQQHRVGFNGSMEDKEQYYEQTRARIFGNDGIAMYAPHNNGPHMMSYQYPIAPPGVPYMAMNGGANHGSPKHGGKAQLRNRKEDLSDPDFKRGRHGPRFDSEYGDPVQGGMYAQPLIFSSREYPESGKGPTSPRNGAHVGMTRPLPMHQYPPGTYQQMIAPMSYGMSQPQMYSQGQIPAPYFPVPYGFVPVTPDGMMMPMAMYPGNGMPGVFPTPMSPGRIAPGNGGKQQNRGRRVGNRHWANQPPAEVASQQTKPPPKNDEREEKTESTDATTV